MPQPISPPFAPVASDPGLAEAIDLAAVTPGITVQGLVRVLAAEVGRTKAGDPFHRLELGDPVGNRLTARRFGVGSLALPETNSVVRIAGVGDRFGATLSLLLNACQSEPGIPVTAFLPRMPPERAATVAELEDLIAHIGNPALRAWVTACLDPATIERFRTHPAAMRLHGARVGGLLTHTVRVARIALALVELLPAARIDRDIVLSGVLLHDLGKLEELPPEPGAELTARGRLLGHLTLGVLLATTAAVRIPELTEAQVEAVLHVVLASHGRLEHGSPVAPGTLEALVGHLADLAEARLEQALEAIEGTPAGSSWTSYVKSLGTRLRVPAGSA